MTAGVCGALAAGTVGCASDDEPPIVSITNPRPFSRVLYEYVTVGASVTEETELAEVIFSVDGRELGRRAGFRAQGDECGCEAHLEWDARDASTGPHTIQVQAVDAAGNTGEDEVEFDLVERMLVTGIMVTNEMDDGILDSNLEVEVHLRDADTDEFVGCTGNNQGMDPVNKDDTYYEVVATMVSPMDVALELADVQDRNLIARVIENDDSDHCPAADGAGVDTLANDDDLLGVSPPFAGSALAGKVELSFDGVPALEMRWGRFGGR